MLSKFASPLGQHVFQISSEDTVFVRLLLRNAVDPFNLIRELFPNLTRAQVMLAAH
jgi:hypothetical protein